jgi:DNA-directed RNA polymerase subunit F
MPNKEEALEHEILTMITVQDVLLKASSLQHQQRAQRSFGDLKRVISHVKKMYFCNG